MEAYLRPKRLGISGRHAITGIWESLAPKVGAVLDVGQVNWNSIDPVRIGYVDELCAGSLDRDQTRFPGPVQGQLFRGGEV